jgi:hypothetical protein
MNDGDGTLSVSLPDYRSREVMSAHSPQDRSHQMHGTPTVSSPAYRRQSPLLEDEKRSRRDQREPDGMVPAKRLVQIEI